MILMIFRTRIADRVFEIHSLYDLIFNGCRDYIIPDLAFEPDLVIKTNQLGIKYDKNATQTNEKGTDKVDSSISTPEVMETLSILRSIASIMPSYNTFLMHGSVVATDGFAYMITASSGVGKSTRTELWVESIEGSFVVNGDKPFIRVDNDSVTAFGSPWCGKENWNTNTSVPLRAIFILKRAEDGEETSIKEMSISEAFPFLLRQTYHPENPDAMRKTLHLLKALDGKVKFYSFRSTPTPEAVKLAYETARPK